MVCRRSYVELVVVLFFSVLRINGARQLYQGYGEPSHATNDCIIFECPNNGVDNLALDTIRKTLIGLEDTIVYNLIQRAKLPLNLPAYQNGSYVNHFVMGIEAVQAKFGRYQSPEEIPFFPNGLPPSSITRHNCSQVLHDAAASVSVNKKIWDFYINEFLPLLAPEGDDGNYALAVSADLTCLQAISRRIHHGKYVAEAKFRNDTEVYSAAIRAKDTTTLTNLLTDGKVEEMVKQRVEKKAMAFGQDLDTANSTDFKVEPALAARLYGDWVIPLTKDVEIEYLLRRLD